MKILTFVTVTIACVFNSALAQDVVLPPLPIFQCAKLFNPTQNQIEFTYQFEDDNWRRGRVAPGSAVIIFDANPKHDLTLAIDATGLKYSLETAAVIVDPAMENGRQEPDAQRNDQAQPYHLSFDQQSNVAVFRGHPQTMIDGAVQRCLEALKKDQIDVDAIVAPIDPVNDDPLIREFEFRAAEERFQAEYQRCMANADPPELSIEWERDPGAPEKGFNARLSVNHCTNEAGKSFYEQVVRAVFRLPKEEETREKTYTCAVSVARGFLSSGYQRNGTPRMNVILNRIQDDLRKANIGEDHVHDEQSWQPRVCSNWHHISRGNSHYRWKLMITAEVTREVNRDEFGEPQPGPSQLCIRIATQLEAMKLKGQSNKWERLAAFAVYDSNFSGMIRNTMNPIDKEKEKIEQTNISVNDSPVMQFTRDVSNRLGSSLIVPSK